MNLDEESELVLEELEREVLPKLSTIGGVKQVIGVGSYYLPKDKPPSDLDFLLVLDFSLTDTAKARCIGEAIEVLQKEYSGETFERTLGRW